MFEDIIDSDSERGSEVQPDERLLIENELKDEVFFVFFFKQEK